MKALIFDLFGTLAYIDRPTHPYRLLMKRTSSESRLLVMTSSANSTVKLAKELGVELTTDEIRHLEEQVAEELSRIRVYDDVKETLKQLRDAGFVIIVVSNLARPYGQAKVLLEDVVDYWNFSYDTGVLKPSAQMFTRPVKAYGIEPKDTLVVGDSLASDAEGAKAAGMSFQLIDRVGRYPAQPAITNLKELVPIVLARKG